MGQAPGGETHGPGLTVSVAGCSRSAAADENAGFRADEVTTETVQTKCLLKVILYYHFGSFL